MNFNRFKTSIFALIFSCAGQLFAQQPLGLVVGDLNTTYSVFMNPANVASNYSKRVYVNWWGTSLDAQSSFANQGKFRRTFGHTKKIDSVSSAPIAPIKPGNTKK